MKKLFSILLLLLLMTQEAFAVPAIVANSAVGTFGAPIIITTTSTTSGHLLVVAAENEGTTACVTGVTDNKGNTWHQAPGAAGVDNTGLNCTDIWYAIDTHGAVTSVTVSYASFATANAAVFWEVSGIDTTTPFDIGANHSNISSTTNFFGPAINTRGAHDFVISVQDNQGGAFSQSPYTNDGSGVNLSAYYLPTSKLTNNAVNWVYFGTATTFCVSTAAFFASGEVPVATGNVLIGTP